MESLGDCVGGAGGAAMRVLRVLFGCVWALLFCGCAEEKTYCDGLNESNMPGAIVLVERMDNATRYELTPDDQRVFLPDDLSTLISCGDIDGLGRLELPAPIRITDTRIRWTAPEDLDSSKRCIEIQLSGRTRSNDVQIADTALFPGVDAVPLSTKVWPESLQGIVAVQAEDSWLEDAAGLASAFVVSALSKRTADFRNTTRLRAESQIYYEDTDDGVPPLIIGRAYSFQRGDVPDGLAAHLGVPELQEEGFQCVDLFFGYYEEGD